MAPRLPDVQVLFAEAACGLMVTTRDGTIRLVNQTFCRWLGRIDDELVGKRKFQDLLTTGGQIFHQTHWAPLMQIQGSVAEVKFDVLHRDGHSVPMMMNALRTEHDGVVFYEIAAFVAEDRNAYERELVLSRKRAEEALVKEQQAQRALALTQERLHLALESAQLYLWDIDADSATPRYEDKVAALVGFPQPRLLRHQDFADRMHPEDRDAEREAYAKALDPTHGRYVAMYRLEGADGIERTIKSSGRAFFDENGGLVHFVGVLHDVTELHQQRAAAEDRALLAEQMIGIVSHDLRNPLFTVQMGAALLNRGNVSAQQRRVIERMTSATARASRLIGDLLDFTQARLGRGLTVHPAPVDVHRLVSDSVEELALAFPERSIKHLAPEGQGACLADADRIAQAIGNLVANAITHGSPDGPVLVASRIESERFTVEVNNEGPPIPRSLVPRLFQPMTRGASDTTPVHSVGLGLFIVNEIVRAHGGKVGVESSASTGTRFVMTFPRTDVESA